MDFTYQSLYDRAKNIIKKNVTVACYKNQEMYLGTDVLQIGLGPSPLQMRDGMQFPRNEAPANVVLWLIAFTNKSLASIETYYSNIEQDTLGILHGLEDFHHYCFAHEVSIITNHKLLVTISMKDVASYHTGFKEY